MFYTMQVINDIDVFSLYRGTQEIEQWCYLQEQWIEVVAQ